MGLSQWPLLNPLPGRSRPLLLQIFSFFCCSRVSMAACRPSHCSFSFFTRALFSVGDRGALLLWISSLLLSRFSRSREVSGVRLTRRCVPAFDFADILPWKLLYIPYFFCLSMSSPLYHHVFCRRSLYVSLLHPSWPSLSRLTVTCVRFLMRTPFPLF